MKEFEFKTWCRLMFSDNNEDVSLGIMLTPRYTRDQNVLDIFRAVYDYHVGATHYQMENYQTEIALSFTSILRTRRKLLAMCLGWTGTIDHRGQHYNNRANYSYNNSLKEPYIELKKLYNE